MFQYAFGRALSLRKKSPFLLDISGFARTSAKDTQRSFSLNAFNICAEIATQQQTKQYTNLLSRTWRKLWRKLHPEKLYTFDPKEFDTTVLGSYYEGWWQNEKYFLDIEDTIRKEFLPKDLFSSQAERMHERIRVSNNSVSLHIRRGDYVTNIHAHAHHGLVPTEYYQKALEYITYHAGSHISVFIFSDDIEWAKHETWRFIPDGADTIYVSDNNIPDFEELMLMSVCKHHVIANSSFSWWGAWLNPDKAKIVIAPKVWVADPLINTEDATPSQWIRM